IRHHGERLCDSDQVLPVPLQPHLLYNSTAVKVACYILIGVGAFSMLMGFLGCLGAIYEIRCLLGLYFTCLLLILIAQIAAGALIYFQKNVLNDEMSKIVTKVLDNYPGNNSTTEQAWDFIQRNMGCCGWNGRMDWNGNMVIVNSSQLLFPCSCQNISLATGNFSESGFCEAQTPDWPVYDVGCADSVESWLLTNIGVVLGICLGVAFIELLGMILPSARAGTFTQKITPKCQTSLEACQGLYIRHLQRGSLCPSHMTGEHAELDHPWREGGERRFHSSSSLFLIVLNRLELPGVLDIFCQMVLFCQCGEQRLNTRFGRRSSFLSADVKQYEVKG
ncbi:CD82 antigen-like protein, partial [Lates japonicus]